jgi:hypothetical protein
MWKKWNCKAKVNVPFDIYEGSCEVIRVHNNNYRI